MIRIARSLSLSAALAAAALAEPAAAFPDRDVDYVIPFSPGGESDIAARLQQPVFADLYGHALEPTYLPGAGGALAWSQLNALPADGHTIMGVNLPHIVLQPLGGAPGYDTEDLTPVYWFHYTPNAIVVEAGSQFDTLADLVAFARRNPGLVTFAGTGVRSANSLAKARFDALAGIVTAVGTVVLVPILAGLYVILFPVVLSLVTGEEWSQILRVFPAYVWASVGVTRTLAVSWSPFVGLVLVPLGALVGWAYQRGRRPRSR